MTMCSSYMDKMIVTGAAAATPMPLPNSASEEFANPNRLSPRGCRLGSWAWSGPAELAGGFGV